MRYFSTMIILVVLVAACGGKQEPSHSDHDGHMHGAVTAKMVDEERLIYYSCPMQEHKHIHSMEPGECSICGMEMKAGVITTEEKMEFWGCPMEVHSHIRQDAPGTCELCMMKLQPMRLVTVEADSTEG